MPNVAVLAEPWILHVDGGPLTVRPSVSRDLAAVAVMHLRCSARSLLARYGQGGRAPSVIALDRQLRAPLSFIVTSPPSDRGPGAAIATAALVSDKHGPRSVRVRVLVEDGWQRQGLGRELVRHLAGAATLAGYSELIASSPTGTAVAQRLLVGIGPTRYVADPQGGHLHTALPASAMDGLGPLRTGRLTAGDHGLDYVGCSSDQPA
jgi:GNAT superfamily N-acetyltransferase